MKQQHPTLNDAIEYVRQKIISAKNVSRELLVMRILLIEVLRKEGLEDELNAYKKLVENIDNHFKDNTTQELTRIEWRKLEVTLRDDIAPTDGIKNLGTQRRRKRT